MCTDSHERVVQSHKSRIAGSKISPKILDNSNVKSEEHLKFSLCSLLLHSHMKKSFNHSLLYKPSGKAAIYYIFQGLLKLSIFAH